MTRPRTTLLIATLAVLALLAGAAIPAAASHDTTDSDADSSVTDALFGTSDSDDDGLVGDITRTVGGGLGVASGTLDRVAYQYSPFGPEPDSAEQNAEETMQAFNERSESFVTYANDRNVSGGEVVQITFDQADAEETIYLVAEYNQTSDAYESAEMVNTTDRTVDETVTVSGMAADNAAAEIEAFHSEFVEPNDDVTTSWLAKQWAAYNEDLESSLIEGGEMA
jgi:hypothetical protein